MSNPYAVFAASDTAPPEQALKVNWVGIPMYNTLIGIAAGVGLVSIVLLGRKLLKSETTNLSGWAVHFGVLGVLLLITSTHMTLTWPVAKLSPYANIAFGEPGMVFGTLLLAAAVILWKRPAASHTPLEPKAVLTHLAEVSKPISILVAAFGLAMIGIAIAGVQYELWGAPPAEPISGEFANHPLVESIFISLLYLSIGVGQLLFPIGVRNLKSPVIKVIGFLWFIPGVAWIIFSAMNYYTHIGLIINTM